ncbi:Hypothetical predicted protein [Xyrichtys novacula]|uniref:Uncharacterized protein n=1 Tax=Xyrichtys novacula TaxID=13765 RepID=A0AAV1FV65_XYRNO|nr:Hypothetical predicted protein [Xyrichtys novacula]
MTFGRSSSYIYSLGMKKAPTEDPQSCFSLSTSPAEGSHSLSHFHLDDDKHETGRMKETKNSKFSVCLLSFVRFSFLYVSAGEVKTTQDENVLTVRAPVRLQHGHKHGCSWAGVH